MKAILKAFRDALVADGTLTTLIPAANIYAGLRDEKTDLPAIDVFMVAGTTEPYAGAKVGGMTKIESVVQVSVYDRSESDALTISDQVLAILLADNTILNAAGIKNTTMIATPASLRDANLPHIAIRFRYGYHITT